MQGVSRLQLPYTPQCGLGTGREEPLLPGSPSTGCSRRSSALGSPHQVLDKARQEQHRQVTRKAAVEPGGHGAHGHGSTEHPQTEGRAPAGAGMLLTVPPSWQGVGRALPSEVPTTMPVVSVGWAQRAYPSPALQHVLSTSSANYLLH